MQISLPAMILASWLLATAGALAQTTPEFTATCKDGTSYSGATKSGACKGHGGVNAWQTPAAGAAGAPATTTTPKTPSTTAAAQKPPAPGQVWVNTESKIYHCAGSKWYGNTKHGAYMSAGEATAKGYRLAKGEACS